MFGKTILPVSANSEVNNDVKWSVKWPKEKENVSSTLTSVRKALLGGPITILIVSKDFRLKRIICIADHHRIGWMIVEFTVFWPVIVAVDLSRG